MKIISALGARAFCRLLTLCCLLAVGAAGSSASAQSLVNGGSVNGSISPVGDLDQYTFSASAGEGFQIQIADVNSTALIPHMRLYDPGGVLLDNTWGGSVASITRTAATSGTFTLEVTDFNSSNTGAYRVYFTLAPGANEGGALDNGGHVFGTVDLGDLDSFTFDAVAGEGFQIQLADVAGTTLVPLMRLYSPTGTLLHSTWGGSVASLTRTAATSGKYTLVVSDFSLVNTGDYRVYFTLAPGANEGGALINGGDVSDTIDLGDLDSFTFDAIAGEGFQIQMTDVNSTALVPLMRLYSPAGTLIHSTWGGSVASMTRTAETSGKYTLVVSDFNAPGTGDYRVYFTLRPGANEGGPLINGGEVSGTIELGDLDSFVFDAVAGEGFQIQMTDVNSTALVPLMRLYNPSGVLVHNAWGGSVASMTRTAAASGTYTLVVSDFNATGTGDYKVYFTLAPGANEGGALINGGDLPGTVDLGDLDSFVFNATAGEGFQIQIADVNGTNLVPLMRLYDPAGVLIDNAWGGSVGSMTRTATTSGTYTLVVSDFNSTGTGDYRVYFTLVPGANENGTLTSGAQLEGTIDLGDLDSFTFFAYSGEDFTVEMSEIGSSSLTPLLRLYGPTGTLLQNAWGGSLASLVATAGTTGTYTLVASDFNSTGTGPYGMSFSRDFETYCTAGTTASGCVAQISAGGEPSATAGSGFVLNATGGEGAKPGIFFFGTSGRMALPWGTSSSFLCVQPPIQRLPLVAGGGTVGNCDALAQFDLAAYFAANPGSTPAPGTLVQTQFWFRDPQNPSGQTSSLSDALEFVVHP